MAGGSRPLRVRGTIVRVIARQRLFSAFVLRRYAKTLACPYAAAAQTHILAKPRASPSRAERASHLDRAYRADDVRDGPPARRRASAAGWYRGPARACAQRTCRGCTAGQPCGTREGAVGRSAAFAPRHTGLEAARKLSRSGSGGPGSGRTPREPRTRGAGGVPASSSTARTRRRAVDAFPS